MWLRGGLHIGCRQCFEHLRMKTREETDDCVVDLGSFYCHCSVMSLSCNVLLEEGEREDKLLPARGRRLLLLELLLELFTGVVPPFQIDFSSSPVTLNIRVE